MTTGKMVSLANAIKSWPSNEQDRVKYVIKYLNQILEEENAAILAQAVGALYAELEKESPKFGASWQVEKTES